VLTALHYCTLGKIRARSRVGKRSSLSAWDPRDFYRFAELGHEDEDWESVRGATIPLMDRQRFAFLRVYHDWFTEKN
jgi:hypothetical protein